MLEGIRSYRPGVTKYFIGMRGRHDYWTWFDGTSLNESLWVSGHPTRDVDNLGCAYLSAGLSIIKNGACKSHRYPLCQKRSGKL